MRAADSGAFPVTTVNVLLFLTIFIVTFPSAYVIAGAQSGIRRTHQCAWAVSVVGQASVNSGLLVIAFSGSQKLYVDFWLHGGVGTSNPCAFQGRAVCG